VLALLDSLNIPSKKCELKKGEKLGFSDFISLVRRLRAHPAVSELYEGYRYEMRKERTKVVFTQTVASKTF
jgi:hypothetical protein